MPDTTESGDADIQAQRISLQFERGDIGYFSQFKGGLPRSVRLGLSNGSTQTGVIIENSSFTLTNGQPAQQGVYGRNVSLESNTHLYLTGDAILASGQLVLRTVDTLSSLVNIVRNPSAPAGERRFGQCHYFFVCPHG